MRLALPQRSVDHPHQHDDAEIGVVPAVDQQRLQRRLGLAAETPGRGRQPVHDRLQHVGHALTGLGGDQHRTGGVQADHLLDLGADALRLGGRQVDLVEHRHDLVVGLDRLVDVGQRLRLHPLAGVDDQQRTLAGRQRPVHLVGEIDMAGRVDQVQVVGFAVLGLVAQVHGLRLDGDAALALDVHGIEHLLLHFPLAEPAGRLDQPVGQRRLAMVDMGDDGEVADVRQRHMVAGSGCAGFDGLAHGPACSTGTGAGKAEGGGPMPAGGGQSPAASPSRACQSAMLSSG